MFGKEYLEKEGIEKLSKKLEGYECLDESFGINNVAQRLAMEIGLGRRTLTKEEFREGVNFITGMFVDKETSSLSAGKRNANVLEKLFDEVYQEMNKESTRSL